MKLALGWRGRSTAALWALVLLTHCTRPEPSSSAPGEDPAGAPAGAPAAPIETPQDPPAATPPPEAQGPSPAPVPPPALPRSFTFEASADTYVDQDAPDQNFRSADTLRVGPSASRRAQLRFDVYGLEDEVRRATLRLYATGTAAQGPSVSFIPPFTERRITWKNSSPANDSVLDDAGAVSRGTWVEYDVSEAVRGSGAFFFELGARTPEALGFASHEAAEAHHRPQLVVTTEPRSGCAPSKATEIYNHPLSQSVSVSENDPTRYSGRARELTVGAAPDRWESFLRFSYGGRTRWTPRDVRLRLYVQDGTSLAPALHPAGNEWPELSGINDFTWNTRPPVEDTAVAHAGVLVPGTWAEYDLSRVANRTETDYAFALRSTPSTGITHFVRAGPYAGPIEHSPWVRVTTESDFFCTYRGTGGGRLGWAGVHGGEGGERLYDLATDAQGGFVVLGHFPSEFPDSEWGLTLARHDARGRRLWIRHVVSGTLQTPRLAVTPTGEILVAAQYTGSPDLGLGPLPAARVRSLLLARFSPSGQTLWSRGYVSTPTHPGDNDFPDTVPTGVATDGQGSLLVAGSFQGSLDLGSGVLVSNPDHVQYGRDATHGGFVAKFDARGEPVWSRVLTGDTQDASSVIHLSADPSGHVFVSGHQAPNSQLGAEDEPSPEPREFIAKYGPTGALAWNRPFVFKRGGIDSLRPMGDSGQVVFSTSFGGPFVFGGAPYFGGVPGDDSPANVSGFLGTLSATGAEAWFKPLAVKYGTARLVASEAEHFTFSFQDAGDFGGGLLGEVTRGTQLVRYSAAGEHQWSRLLDPHLRDPVNGLPVLHAAPLPGGGILAGGAFPAPIWVEGVEYTPRGASDLLFLRLEP